MIIGIDIDDTITDTYEVMHAYAQEYTINVLKREPIINETNSCSNHLYIQYLHNWNEEEDLKYLELYYEKIIKEVRPKTLALKNLNKLKEDGHKIVLITARWETDYTDIVGLTKEWLKENNVPYDKLILNAENKAVAAKQENLDIFIDDSFKNCQMVADLGIKTFIMDTRTNRNLEDERLKRVYSWPHFYEVFKNMIKEAK